MEGRPPSESEGFKPPSSEPDEPATPAPGEPAAAGPEAVAPPPEPATYAAPAPPAAESPRYAGWGYRVGAYLTDSGLALCVAILAAIVFGGDDDDTESAIVGIAAIAAWILVTSVAMGVFKGQTVGKRIAGIRVVLNDRPVGFGFSLLRDQVLRVLYLVPLFFIVDSIWAAADSQRQSLRDKMVGTHVVHAGANAARAVAIGVLATVLVAGWIALTVALDSDGGADATPTGTGADEPGYSDLDRQVFIDSCTGEGAQESYCACLFDYIAPRVPYETFNSVESDDPDTWPARLRDTMAAGIDECS
jgi:uncharacterized RDD family membrane protein YckC